MELPRPNWAEFRERFAQRWVQGEHVFISGKTGSGKTELLLELMAMRKYSMIFCTKPDDDIFRTPQAKAYRKTQTWNPTAYDRRIMLAPSDKGSTADIKGVQRAEFAAAIDAMYASRGWSIGADEVAWMSDELGLKQPIATLHHMGRAKGLTVVAATQRPMRIPVIVPQSATYAFVGRAMRDDDLKVLAELGAVDRREMIAAIKSVTGKHDFLFIDTEGEWPLQIVNTRAT